MGTTTWVAGLYNDVSLQPAPASPPRSASLLDLEERRILLPTLPAEAELFYDELGSYKVAEFRAGLQANAEFDARWILPGRPPSAFDELEWQRFTGRRFSQATGEAETGLAPILPARAWDETDWQRAFAGFSVFPAEDEQPERLPFTPQPMPNLGWDDFEWSHDFGARGMAMLVVMDDFVNAPAGTGTGGQPPRGRAVRLGFAMPAFR
jgi:hypothetical protein